MANPVRGWDNSQMSLASEELIIVIGRGHSGTSALAKTLGESGVFLGDTLNSRWDTNPPKLMYEACLIVAKHVRWNGGLSWDFEELHSMPLDPRFETMVAAYLESVLASRSAHRGWKLPETTLAYPWIVRMLPAGRYIHLVRDPRDALLKKHLTDDLGSCDVGYPQTEDKLEQRVASWKYQHEIVKATPRPEHFISIRYEDLVLDQEHTLKRLEEFLGLPLARIEMDTTRVGQWKQDRRLLRHMQPIARELRELGYCPESRRYEDSAAPTAHGSRT